MYTFDLGLERNFLNEGGMYSDGETMWITNIDDGIIIAYTMATISGAKQRVPSKDIVTVSGNDRPSGIWANGTTMWVGDTSDNKIYAYNMRTKARDAAKDFDEGVFRINRGLFSDGTTMLGTFGGASTNFGLSGSDIIIAYNIVNRTRDMSKNIIIDDATVNNTGLWSDGETMWVLEGVRKNARIKAYTLSTNARDTSKYFILDDASRHFGLWSDGQIMWVYNASSNRIEAYDMSTRMRLVDYQPVNP